MLVLVDPAPTLIEVVKELERTHRKRQFEAMRLCFHDEALIESVAAGTVLGPDETVAAIEEAFRDGIYSMGRWTIDSLEPDVVLAWAGVRHRPDATGRISDNTVYWLVTGRDGQ